MQLGTLNYKSITDRASVELSFTNPNLMQEHTSSDNIDKTLSDDTEDSTKPSAKKIKIEDLPLLVYYENVIIKHLKKIEYRNIER